MSDGPLSYGNRIQNYRDASFKQPQGQWTFVCKRCKKLKSLQGHKQRKINGKYQKICKQCVDAENDND